MERLDWPTLLALGFPWAYLTVCPERAVDDFVVSGQHLGSAPVTRIMRGNRCADIGRLFQEWAAALQFPYYFGGNWDAFEECLGDLNWLPGAGYVFFVTHGHLILPDVEGDLAILCRILDTVAKEWESPPRPSHPTRPATPFRVVFHSEHAHGADIRGRLVRAGIRVVEGSLPTALGLPR